MICVPGKRGASAGISRARCDAGLEPESAFLGSLN